MWPFDRAQQSEVLRVGRNTAERWSLSREGLSLVNAEPINEGGGDLAQMIGALYRESNLNPRRKITVVVESAWMPLMLVDTGEVFWRTLEVQELVRHRLQLQYADYRMPGFAAELRLDYRGGDKFALGYALPKAIKESLFCAAKEHGLTWAAIVPAFDWGLQRLQPDRHWTARTGWWIWPEQDRMLVSKIVNNKIVALNAGATIIADHVDLRRLIEVESARNGILSKMETVGVAVWGGVPDRVQNASQLQYFSVDRPTSRVRQRPNSAHRDLKVLA